MQQSPDYFLVMLVHTMDDLPLKMFGRRDRALEFASTVEPMPSEEILELFQTDCSTPVCVKVIDFSYTEKGLVPTKVEAVKVFE